MMVHGCLSLEVLVVSMMADAGVVIQSAVEVTRPEFLVLLWISARLLSIVVGCVFTSVAYLADLSSGVGTVACGATARGWAVGLTCVNGVSSSGGWSSRVRAASCANRHSAAGFGDRGNTSVSPPKETSASCSSFLTGATSSAAGKFHLPVTLDPCKCRTRGRRSTRDRVVDERPTGLPGQLAVAAAGFRVRYFVFCVAAWPSPFLRWLPS